MIAEDATVGPRLQERGFDPTLAAGLAAVVVLVVAILILRARAARTKENASATLPEEPQPLDRA